MPRIAYVNGRYVAHADAAVHIEDRGYQFADGVYEVCEVARGFIVDMTRHLDRLDRSLSRTPDRLADDAGGARRSIMREVIRRNHVRNGLVYLQVTRGVARRDHVFPAAGTRAVAGGHRQDDRSRGMRPRRPSRHQGHHRAGEPLGPRRHQDRRPAAQRAGPPAGQGSRARRRPGSSMPTARSRKGLRPMPGSSPGTACWSRGRPITASCAASRARRCSTSRQSSGSRSRSAALRVDEAKAAREVFITAATTIVMPIVAIDGQPVANGHPGSVALSLREAFFDVAEKIQA